ncbi:MAG: TetR/AcrR family transcriptional regulator [Microthrixaceae bacterium]
MTMGDNATATPTLTTRQHLSDRQRETVTALLDAAESLLRTTSYDELTLRIVATQAGVTHTTAYTYFSSKDHLVAQIFWRRLQGIAHPVHDDRASLHERVDSALREPGLALRDEPVLAQAALAALLTHDPDVQRLRDEIGADLAARLGVALGDRVPPAVAESILLVFSGAMLQAGMGYFDYSGVVSRVLATADLLEGG